MSHQVNSTYEINRGVNSTVEFNGIKGKFLYYIVGVLVGSFFLFVVLNAVIGSSLIAIMIAGAAGAGGWVYVTGISKKHGEHGLDRKLVQSKAAKVYQIQSRRVFLQLKKTE
jgi:hypothetical protein